MKMSDNRASQLIQQLRDALEMGDDDLADQIRSDLFKEFDIEMANGGRVSDQLFEALGGEGTSNYVKLQLLDALSNFAASDGILNAIGPMVGLREGGRVGLQTGGLPTVASILGLQSLQAGQTPSATPDLDALGLQSLLPPRPNLQAMTQQAGNPMNVPNPYNYGYGPSADFGRRNLDALQYTGDSAFPMLQDIFGKDTGTLTQQELDDRLAAQKKDLSSTFQGQIDAKTLAMAEAQKAKEAAATAASTAAADAAAKAKEQADAIAKLKAELAALQAAPPQIKEIIKYIPRPGGGGSCFVAGTLVTMEDGTLKKIEKVSIGDKLQGENGVNMVTDYDKPKLGDRKLYSINNGDPFVTSEHPFKTPDGWKAIDPEETAKETDMPVEKLSVGDVIITGKDKIKVDNIEAHDGNAEDTVYNFILNGDRTYYADGYLVHNKGHGGGGGGGCFIEGTPIDMADGSSTEITNVRVGDETKGGRVIAKLEFEPTQIYNYRGVYVSGTHLVLEDNQMVEVQHSQHGVITDRIEPVYCFETTGNRIWVQGIEFGDYLTGSQKDWEPHIEMMRKKINDEIQNRHQKV